MDTLPVLHFSFILLLFGLCLGSLWFYAYGIYAAIDYWAHADPEIDVEFHPKLTVLKPLWQANAQTHQVLQSFCQQDYPHYQIVFAVQNSADLCIAMVQKLMQQYPDRDIDLVIGPKSTSSNSKTNLLAYAAAVAKYGLWVISDPDITVGADYLQQIVQPFRYPGIGVVTCPYRSQPPGWPQGWPQGWLSRLVALGTAAEFHPLVLTARRMQSVKFALSSTIAIRRDVLLELGGFAAIAQAEAADYQLGHLAAKVGFRVMLSHYVVDRVLTPSSGWNHLQHQTHWTRTLWNSQPSGDWGRLISYGTVTSLLLLWLLQGSGLGWSIFIMIWATRFGMAYWINKGCLKAKPIRHDWLFLPLYDLLSFIFWWIDLVGRSLRRNRIQQIKQQSSTYDLPRLEEPALEEI